MKNEDLDKLFKSKLSDDRNFPFDEENWTAFQKMMSNRKKTNKRRFLLLALLLTATTGLFVAASVAIFSNGKKTIARIEQKRNQKVVYTTIKSENSEHQDVSNTAHYQSIEKTPSNKKETENVYSSNKQNYNKDLISEQETSKTEKTKYAEKSQLANTKNSKYYKAAQKQYDLYKVAAILGGAVSHINDSNKLIENESYQEKESKIILSKYNDKKNNSVDSSYLPILVQNQLVKKVKSEVQTPDGNEVDTVKNETFLVEEPDSTVKQPSQNIINQRHTFTVWSGLTMSGLSQYEWKEKPSIRPTIGLNYSYQLMPLLMLQVGLGYALHTNKHNAIRYESKFYDFGLTQTKLSIIYKELHFLEIPLQLSYQIDRKQRIAAGLQYMQLFRTSSTLEKQESNQMTPIVNKKWSASGYYAGLNTRLYLINLRYDYFVHKNWSLAAQIAYSPQKMTETAVKYQEKPIQFKLFINYHFLKF